MSIAKNEIIEIFIRELKAAEEYNKPLLGEPENANPGPNPEPEYRYNPEEKPYRGPWHPERKPEHLKQQDEARKQKLEQIDQPEYSDEEYFSMADKEPEHVVTNLMLQRKAPYSQFKYVYPLAKSLMNWMSEANYSPEEGSILYEETKYMLDIIEQEAERKEHRETDGNTPTSGETEWKPE